MTNVGFAWIFLGRSTWAGLERGEDSGFCSRRGRMHIPTCHTGKSNCQRVDLGVSLSLFLSRSLSVSLCLSLSLSLAVSLSLSLTLALLLSRSLVERPQLQNTLQHKPCAPSCHQPCSWGQVSCGTASRIRAVDGGTSWAGLQGNRVRAGSFLTKAP